MKPGTYDPLIDGTAISAFSSDELAAGVNLAAVATTPQYQQALRVSQTNAKRHGVVSGNLRCIAAVDFKAHVFTIRPKP